VSGIDAVVAMAVSEVEMVLQSASAIHFAERQLNLTGTEAVAAIGSGSGREAVLWWVLAASPSQRVHRTYLSGTIVVAIAVAGEEVVLRLVDSGGVKG
jgi:hypothetical protein